MGFADSFDKAFYIREKFVFCLMEGPDSAGPADCWLDSQQKYLLLFTAGTETSVYNEIKFYKNSEMHWFANLYHINFFNIGNEFFFLICSLVGNEPNNRLETVLALVKVITKCLPKIAWQL